MAMDSVASPLGYAQIGTLTTSVGFSSVPNGTQLTLITAEAQNVRWRDDGVAPTASIGMLLPAGQTLSYNGPAAKLRFIEVTAGAKINASFYGR